MVDENQAWSWSQRPKVTAVVPSYNAAEFIKATLDSLAAQTWGNLEILIGDDCSRDATPEILRDFAAGHNNARVVPRSRNLGWIDNSNDLMARAQGEFIFFAFHDDVLDAEYVEKLVKCLLQRPEAVIAFSDLEVVDADGSKDIVIFDSLSKAHAPLARGLVMCGAPNGWWAAAHGLFRAHAYRQTGGLRKHALGEFSADFLWLLNLSLLGDFARLPQTLCHKRVHKAGLTLSLGYSVPQMDSLMHAAIGEVLRSKIGLLLKIPLIVKLAFYKERSLVRRWKQRRKRHRIRRQIPSGAPAQKVGDQL